MSLCQHNSRLKHCVYVYYECMKQSEMDIRLNHDEVFTPQMTMTSLTLIWGQIGQWGSIRVHLDALETVYQWLKHLVYVNYGCMNWSEVDNSLNCDVVASFHSTSDPEYTNLWPAW